MRTFAKVTARDGLLLHRGPSEKSERIELMPLGARVEIIDEKNSMSHVEWHSPKLGQLRGYAHEHWLKVDAINPSRVDPDKPSNGWFIAAGAVAIVLIVVAVRWWL